MKLHHLRPAPGATRRKCRVGRGRAAGQGKTAGRGTKGYGARHNPKLGFEGGQMPLQRRVPKLKGFTNRNRVEYSVVNVATLAQAFEGGEVDLKLGFEGGQMPLQRRVPKLKGFTNRNRVEYSVVNVATLAQAFEGGEVDP